MSKCVKCGADFPCGAAEGDGETCWCMDLPPLDSALFKENGGCLCPACLMQLSRQPLQNTEAPDSSQSEGKL